MMIKKITSIWEMCTSQCVIIKNNQRVFEVKTLGNSIEIGIYYNDILLGYIYPRNKKTFKITFKQYELDFSAIIKYQALTGYGNKLNNDRVGHILSEKLSNRLINQNNHHEKN